MSAEFTYFYKLVYKLYCVAIGIYVKWGLDEYLEFSKVF